MSVVNSGLRSRYEQQFLPKMEQMPGGEAACIGKHDLFQKLIEGRGGRKEARLICDGCPLRGTCPARVKAKAPNKTPGQSAR
jgi:hypothetical protein